MVSNYGPIMTTIHCTQNINSTKSFISYWCTVNNDSIANADFFFKKKCNIHHQTEDSQ